MERKTLTLIGLGFALLIASAGMYAQPPLETYEPDTTELNGTFDSELNQPGYVPAEDKWWSVTNTGGLEDPLQEEPPATTLSEGNSQNFIFTTGIAGLLFITSGLLRNRENN